MSAKSMWAINLICLVSCLLLVPFFAGRSIRTRTTVTMSRLAVILTDIDLLDEELYRSNPKVVSSALDYEEINRNLALLLNSTTNQDVTSRKLVSKDGLIRDAWGTSLFFLPTNSSLMQRVNPVLKEGTRALIAWSAGENRKNEFGNGDDVFSYR